ncbi:ArsR/SmtB family transcription factor [Rossellomorea sp. FS2]|uniref:ArsR/SmtB family transcription factor n=1 Tax=Rossellomorea sp. FS2 TaxID=3391447 RepID=UPI003A4E1AB6
MIIEQRNLDEIRVDIFKALADPTRLEILRLLKNHGDEMSCGEVGNRIHLTKSTASYHFKILREAGLTTTRKEAKHKYVQIYPDTFSTYLPGFLDSL